MDYQLVKENQPRDKLNSIWILCMVLGIGHLFPWNAYISAFGYFSNLFKPFPFLFVLPIVNNWSSIVMFLILTKFGERIPAKQRLYTSYFLCILMLFMVPVINMWDWYKNTRMILSLVTAFFAGGTTAVMIGTSFGLVAVLPPQYTGALMSGQGVAGIIAGLLQICVNFWWFPSTSTDIYQLKTSGALYFGIASLVLIAVTYCTWILTSTNFYKFYHNKSSVQPIDSMLSNSDFISDSDIRESTKMGVFKKIWLEAVHVWLIFVVTLSLFPGFTSRMKNFDPDHISDNNFGTILITLFQFWDMVGRTLPKWWQFPSKKWLWIPIWIRFAFYPLILLSVFTNIFPNNYISYVVVSIFAVTNGYFSTLAMMYGPTRVGEKDIRVAGTMMAFFLQFGVFCGVHLAMLLLYLFEGSSAVIS